MPNCYQLLRDGEAVPLAQVDEEMCLHFSEPCDPLRYLFSWHDVIGYDLAAGRSFEQIRSTLASGYSEYPILVQIAEWLEHNFAVRAWYESSSLRR